MIDFNETLTLSDLFTQTLLLFNDNEMMVKISTIQLLIQSCVFKLPQKYFSLLKSTHIEDRNVE